MNLYRVGSRTTIGDYAVPVHVSKNNANTLCGIRLRGGAQPLLPNAAENDLAKYSVCGICTLEWVKSLLPKSPRMPAVHLADGTQEGPYGACGIELRTQIRSSAKLLEVTCKRCRKSDAFQT